METSYLYDTAHRLTEVRYPKGSTDEQISDNISEVKGTLLGRIVTTKITALVLSFITLFASCYAQGEYEHKSEEAIAAMNPSQRVDEMVKERYHHYPFDSIDMKTAGRDQSVMIKEYIRKDGVKALPVLTDISNRHDPSQRGIETKRMLVAFELAVDIDNRVIRIGTTKEGRSLIAAFERVIDRMKTEGYGDREHALHDRFQFIFLKNMEVLGGRAYSLTDGRIRSTLRKKHDIQLSREEMIKFSGFLTSHDPTYPSRCKTPSRPLICTDSKEYYEAYLKFKAEEKADEVTP